MFARIFFLVFVSFYFGGRFSFAEPAPPQWATVWMATGSGHSLVNNETIAFQMFYDWTQKAQVINLMREDTFAYTILHNGTTVWRLQRSNRSCCVDPNHTGVTPVRPDWLKIDNTTVYDGLVVVSEHLCHSWTKNIPDVAIFSWLVSAATDVPCRLAIPNAMYADIAYYSENRNLLPKGIFQVPDYCPREVTDPNCDVMHF